MKWLEISLTLSGELAEAVSDLLTRYTPNSVVLELPPQSENAPNQDLIAVRAYLPADEELENLRFAIEEGLWHLSRISALPQAQYRFLEEADWGEAWKAHYRPIPIGKRLLIYPAWLPSPETDRSLLLIDPGMAFGTGTHPTTQLCLLALEEVLKPGQAVLDLGCGSGILSIAAARLGAARVLALDVDPLAVSHTQENILRNNLSDRIFPLLGSLELLLENVSDFGLPVDLILANILAKTIEELLKDGLPRLVRPDGLMVLSGILADQTHSLTLACQSLGLEILQIKAQQDWRAILVKQTSPHI